MTIFDHCNNSRLVNSYCQLTSYLYSMGVCFPSSNAQRWAWLIQAGLDSHEHVWHILLELTQVPLGHVTTGFITYYIGRLQVNDSFLCSAHRAMSNTSVDRPPDKHIEARRSDCGNITGPLGWMSPNQPAVSQKNWQFLLIECYSRQKGDGLSENQSFRAIGLPTGPDCQQAQRHKDHSNSPNWREALRPRPRWTATDPYGQPWFMGSSKMGFPQLVDSY